MSCVAPPTGNGFLAATLNHLDCQAQTIGEAGYQALASPGSPLSLALTALLAIFVAIIGLRYLSGRALNAGEWIGAALKVGFVLALTASWPAYRTVAYDVVLKAPAEISTSIGRSSALPGTEGGLTARLQNVDNGITALVQVGSGRNDVTARTQANAIAPPVNDDSALGWGKTLFVSSIIGSFGLLRLAGGLFLALAPLMAGFLLFDATRFLFFGWLRSLIAVALGSLGLAVLLGVKLAIIEPWLAQVLALRATRVATLSAPFELMALTLAFTLAMIGLFVLVLRIAFASDAVMRVQAVIERTAQSLHYDMPSSILATAAVQDSDVTERTRAQMVAQSVQQVMNRQGQTMAGEAAQGIAANRTIAPANTPDSQQALQHTPLGRSYHSPSRRVGAQALKRKPTA
jgi:type IV secretion system protein VirB6